MNGKYNAFFEGGFLLQAGCRIQREHIGCHGFYPLSTMVDEGVMTSYWPAEKSDSGYDQEVSDRRMLPSV